MTTKYGGTGRAMFAAVLVLVAGSAQAQVVNIYSDRQEALIKPQLEAFKQATGIAYNLITGGSDGLIQRLKDEGSASPADVLFTVDVGRLWRAKQLEVLQPIQSEILVKNIPEHFRDPDNQWFGLGIRARPIFYNVDKVKPADLSTYEALADAKWKGRILVRSSNSVYNQSLLASIIHHDSAAKAEAWAKGVAANFARKPQGGDSDQLYALAAGEGDIAIANTYYYGRMVDSEAARDRKVAEKVKVFWPNQDGRGTHVNVSGAGVTGAAKHKAEAVKLLEYLVGPEAQKIYAEVGHELPVRPGVPKAQVYVTMGAFKADQIPLEILGRNNAEAVKMFDRVGWP
ncbi:MAG: Fe(3+) ABC transporter substrate-binding protein [Rhodospirillales bacterium]